MVYNDGSNTYRLGISVTSVILVLLHAHLQIEVFLLMLLSKNCIVSLLKYIYLSMHMYISVHVCTCV